MADYREQARMQSGFRTDARTQAEIDQGLRSYMLGIYNYMTIAMVITGGVAMAVAGWVTNNIEAAQLLYGSPLKWVIMLAPLAFVLVMSFGMNRMSAGTLRTVFFAYSAVMGLSLASIFLVYSGASIAQTFFVTAAAFAGLSLFGYTTKKNLSGMGSFLLMGLIGLIVAMLVNLFLQSSALMFAINVIGVLIFAGLVAYDTQRLKHMYDVVMHDGEAMAKTSIMGALSLYLNFVNLFMFLLSFMGNRE